MLPNKIYSKNNGKNSNHFPRESNTKMREQKTHPLTKAKVCFLDFFRNDVVSCSQLSVLKSTPLFWKFDFS